MLSQKRNLITPTHLQIMLLRYCQLLCLLFPIVAFGQSDCEEYDQVIREAQEKLADLDNLDADFVYRKLLTARLKSIDCASSNPTRQFFPEIDETLQQLFNILETQTAAARLAEKRAEERSRTLARQSQQLSLEKARADSLLMLAENQNRQLENSAAELREALQDLRNSQAALLAQTERANAVLNKIYFYNNAYGLATNGDVEDPKYGYINKELITLIPFEYDEALPFDNSGFARVRKGNNALLINTAGDEFRLAENLDQITSAITALDLRRLLDRRRGGTRRRLDRSGNSNLVITKMIPPLVGNYQNLRIILANRGQLNDISNLSRIEKLKELQLSQNKLSDLTPLANMQQIRHLRLDGNTIQDIRPLAGLKSLQTLNLHGNDLVDFSSLTGLTALEWLNLGRNKIKKFHLSLHLPALHYLNLDGNRLVKMSGISNLTSLRELYLRNNYLRSIDAVGPLIHLEKLDVSSNRLASLEGVDSLVNLQELYLQDNQLEDISSLAKLENLVVLDLSENNGIRSLTSLSGLTQLRQLRLVKCRNISTEAVEELRSQLPNCQIVE